MKSSVQREEEKQLQIETAERVQSLNPVVNQKALKSLQNAALENKNIFNELMEAGKICTLGEITNALYQVGGQYRRNM